MNYLTASAIAELLGEDDLCRGCEHSLTDHVACAIDPSG